MNIVRYVDDRMGLRYINILLISNWSSYKCYIPSEHFSTVQ